MSRVSSALAFCSAAWLAATPVAADREQTLAAMQPLLARTDPALDVWINDRSGRPVELGGAVMLHFRAKRDLYLTALYLDAHGALRLLSPGRDPESGRLAAGVEKRLEFVASEPTGVETLVALATDAPTDAAQLLGRAAVEDFPLVDPDDAPEFARRLTHTLSGGTRGALASARVDQRIAKAAGGGPEYSARGIVDYFSARRRAIRRPKLDLHIHFETGAADLGESARRDLDEVGKALRSSELAKAEFTLEGHTDDVGDAGANQLLSERRAASAYQYLVQKHKIDPARLGAEGHGEREPLVRSESEEARAENRRVVLMLGRRLASERR
jgi:outer membrane protein OmpA-like peptidoglycan-associated protein